MNPNQPDVNTPPQYTQHQDTGVNHLPTQPPHINDPSVPHSTNQHRAANEEMPVNHPLHPDNSAPQHAQAQPAGGNQSGGQPGVVKYHGAVATQDPDAAGPDAGATHPNPSLARYHGTEATKDPDAPVTQGTQAQGNKVGSTAAGERLGDKLKGYAAQGHGLGEFVRGNVGAAVDTMAGHKGGMAKHEAVAKRGEEEIKRGEIANKGTHNMKY